MKATTLAFLTESTCGEACWHAKEEVCRCACGGKNHGILLSENGQQPVRTAKINGKRYVLFAVGPRSEISDQLHEIMGERYNYHPHYRGDDYLEKPATPQQAEHWKELAQYRELEARDWYFVAPTLAWQRADVAEKTA
jgi:hypothetical protein